MDIICIDGSFSKECLKIYSEYGVVVPQQDKLYSIRDVIINSNGKTGLLLEELVNPKIPIDHPLFPGEKTMFEPNFDIKRFRTLGGDLVDASEAKVKTKQKL